MSARVALALALVLTACGVKGPPRPPLPEKPGAGEPAAEKPAGAPDAVNPPTSGDVPCCGEPGKEAKERP
jgi:predicted small lipoprotein YifL